MSRSASRSTEEARKQDPKPFEQEIQNLKELEAMLKVETNSRSRQVILAEAASRLFELERQLTGKRAS